MNFTDSFSVAIVNISSVFFNDLADFLMKERIHAKKNPTLNRVGFYSLQFFFQSSLRLNRVPRAMEIRLGLVIKT